MGIRVRIRISYGERSVTTYALLNTGYEGDVPEILVPISIAEKLGLWPNLPENVLIETYRSASGLMRVYRVSNGKVTLLVDDREIGPFNVYIVVSEYSDEPLINDQLISRLGIIIEDPVKGKWSLREKQT